MAIRFGNGFGIGASNNGGGGGGSLSFFTNLVTIASYLKNYMSDFRNPDFYEYELDGNGFHINDGGNDMYDNGNATSPWLISNVTYTGDTEYQTTQDYPYAIDYQITNSPGTMDTSFGYISLGYSSPNYLPLTVIGTRATIASAGTPIGFQCGGNIGADGGGTFVEGNIYTGNTVSGFTVHSYYRQTHSAGDPSVCDVFILLGHPDWNSVFGDVFYGGDSSNQGNGSYLYTTGNGAQNILAIKTTLSKSNDGEVTFSEVNTVVDNFIIRIGEAKDSIQPTPTPTPSYAGITYTNLPNGIGRYSSGVSYSNSYNPFGPGSSYLFDGSTGYIEIYGNSDTVLGTGDFTVEWFQFENSHNQHARIFAIGDYPSATFQVSLEGLFYVMENGTWVASPGYGYINQTWVHFAVVRISGTTTIYKDGQSIHSFSDSNNLTDSATHLHIGQESPVSDSGAYFNGAINNFRWTKGLGIYTGNFTVPTSDLGWTASANPFGGSNTVAIPDGYVKYLLGSATASPTPTPSSAALTPTPTPTPSATMFYYVASGYSCGNPCNLVGSFTVNSPTQLTIGHFYNNPENRGYTFEIISETTYMNGSYDLTGEPGYADCESACYPPTPTPTPTTSGMVPTSTPTPTPTETPTPTLGG